ncbi:MAG: transketolase C-terminal domain-containing protein [Ilumatobacteraceae bacterium]
MVRRARIGEGRFSVRDGDDVLIVTWGNGLYLSLQVAKQPAAEGVSCRVFDLRWLNPLPVDQLIDVTGDVDRAIVVDETRHSGGVGEGVVTALVERGVSVPIRRVGGRPVHPPG